jgi:hypothetical protein
MTAGRKMKPREDPLGPAAIARRQAAARREAIRYTARSERQRAFNRKYRQVIDETG